MLIALIGMSGTGKSHWSIKLSEFGFKRFCCDDLITHKLASELKRSDGTSVDLGTWMGFPFDPGYEEREARYLACEIEVVTEVLDWIERNAGRENSRDIVIDTTGSVIYTGETLLDRLRTLTRLVHFVTPVEVRDALLRKYVAKPRPVLWRGIFARKEGESVEESLRRSYYDLLNVREELYGALADVKVDFFTRRHPEFTVPDFLALLNGQPDLT